MERKELKDVEEGDRVWVGNSAHPHLRLARITRLTFKLMELHGETARFSREDGRPAIGSKFTSSHVTGVATPDECAEWDAEVAERKRHREEREAERERLEVKRTELYALLPKSASISETPRAEGDEWEITLRLSEEGVRRLAAWLTAPVG